MAGALFLAAKQYIQICFWKHFRREIGGAESWFVFVQHCLLEFDLSSVRHSSLDPRERANVHFFAQTAQKVMLAKVLLFRGGGWLFCCLSFSV